MLGFIGNLAKKKLGLNPDAKRNATPSKGGLNYNDDMLTHMKIGSKWSYSTLEYPKDIQLRSDLSHYMMFYVNVPNDTNFPNANKGGGGKKADYSVGAANSGATVSLGYGSTVARSLAQQALNQYGGHKEGSGESTYDKTGQTWKPGESNKVIERAHHDGTGAEQLGMKRTKRTNDSIILYMPPQVNLATAVGYKDSEIGGLAGEVGGLVKNFLDSSKSDGIMRAGLDAIPDVANVIKEQIIKAGAAMASGAGMGDIKGAYDKLANRAENNFSETMFTGVGFRNFSWMWRFTPKNPDEAKEVDKIIRTFRFYMLPELPKDKRYGRYFVVPAEFDIFYMFRGEENSWLNKITSCVLKNCTVNYTPTQYQTFRPMQGRKGAPPIEIEMKLDFQETKLITKSDVMEGY